MDYLYSAPYAGIYRGMGIVAANGVNTLPRYCLLIACLMALGAVIMNLIRVRQQPRYSVSALPKSCCSPTVLCNSWVSMLGDTGQAHRNVEQSAYC